MNYFPRYPDPKIPPLVGLTPILTSELLGSFPHGSFLCSPKPPRGMLELHPIGLPTRPPDLRLILAFSLIGLQLERARYFLFCSRYPPSVSEMAVTYIDDFGTG